MRPLSRLLALLLLGGVFLAASFVGGMMHSIITDLARGETLAWWWARWWVIGAVSVVTAAGWYWRWRLRRSAADTPPQT